MKLQHSGKLYRTLTTRKITFLSSFSVADKLKAAECHQTDHFWGYFSLFTTCINATNKILEEKTESEKSVSSYTVIKEEGFLFLMGQLSVLICTHFKSLYGRIKHAGVTVWASLKPTQTQNNQKDEMISELQQNRTWRRTKGNLEDAWSQ